MAKKAEHKMEKLSYEVEKRCWNFEKYARIHKEQHEILNGLVQHNYYGIDDISEVLYLNYGTKTATLDVPRSKILVTLNLLVHFDDKVLVDKYFLEQHTPYGRVTDNIQI